MSEGFYKLAVGVARRRDLDSTSKIVFAVIADRLRQGLSVGTCRLAQDTGTTLPTVRLAIQRLRESQLLAVNDNGNGHRRTYRIIDDTGKGSDTGKESLPVKDLSGSPVKDLYRIPVKDLSPNTETENTERRNNLGDAGATPPAGEDRGGLFGPDPKDKAGRQPTKGKAKPDSDPRVTPLRLRFEAAYREDFGYPYPVVHGRDNKCIRELLDLGFSEAQIEKAWGAMFIDPFWGSKSSLPILRQKIGDFLAAVKAQKNGKAATAKGANPADYIPPYLRKAVPQ